MLLHMLLPIIFSFVENVLRSCIMDTAGRVVAAGAAPGASLAG